MRDVLRYLADCRYIWLWGLLSGIAYAAVFGLYGIRWEAIWYPLLLAAAFGLFFQALGFLRYRKNHRELERLDPADGPWCWADSPACCWAVCGLSAPGRQPGGTGLSGTGAKRGGGEPPAEGKMGRRPPGYE